MIPAALEGFAPAKLNLFLAITGRRADGFHDLVSVATPVKFGDTLRIALTSETSPHAAGAARFTLTCTDPALEVDDTNLVLRAARAFAVESGWRGGAHFTLEKRIPLGAGLGGGSSDATAVLRGLNTLTGSPLDAVAHARVAAGLGSDCALFLADAPVIMRGRGEHVELLPAAAAARLRGRRVLIFKPHVGIPTAWAYRTMAAAAPAMYLPAVEAEARLAAWIDGASFANAHAGAGTDANSSAANVVAQAQSDAEALLFNNMERPAFEKYLMLPSLLALLRERFGLRPRMSGSGSACFAFLADHADAAPVLACIREEWGAETFAVETHIG